MKAKELRFIKKNNKIACKKAIDEDAELQSMQKDCDLIQSELQTISDAIEDKYSMPREQWLYLNSLHVKFAKIVHNQLERRRTIELVYGIM